MPDQQALILATFGSRDEAERAGEKMVEQQLATDGAVIPTVHTFHFREGRMHRNHEALLLLKTTGGQAAEVLDQLLSESPDCDPMRLTLTP
ncbi:MAG: divalent-cation tolerance protein CutA [Chloroflexi bacterium]|nr:MAG: divalent-cation tolerance protein CutA [Chloroflexota bacterium]